MFFSVFNGRLASQYYNLKALPDQVPNDPHLFEGAPTVSVIYEPPAPVDGRSISSSDHNNKDGIRLESAKLAAHSSGQYQSL
jgi:hypothetical protein